MIGNILESKIRIPIQSQRVVPRPALLAALEQQVLEHKLVLVISPAGYGKTTLLADWARFSSMPVAWLSITGEEVDVDRFLRYLLAAWEKAQPGVMETNLGVLLGGLTQDIQAVLAEFVNAGERAPGPVAFVLDDYHLLQSADIHEAVTFLLNHMPSRLHFVLSSRSEPPLPLARYRARGQLFEFRTDDLYFTLEESAEFLNRQAGLSLAPDEVQSLHAHTEGWIAGLQLAAISLRHRSPGARDLPLVSGRQRFIADFLTEDVLRQLPVDLRDFLIKTSIIERLCGPLCDRITGRDDGQAMLETLEREGLFLAPLDDRREWFRYHPLFAEFLRDILQRRYPGQAKDLHRQAAGWFLAHDFPEEAFHHAVEGEDPGAVMQVFERFLVTKLYSGEFGVVKRWLDTLPEDWYQAYPSIEFWRAVYLSLTGSFEDCARALDGLEQRLAGEQGEDARWPLARVTAMRCLVACVQQDVTRAERYALKALRELPEDDRAMRSYIYHALGDTYRAIGRWDLARDHYLKVFDFAHGPGFYLEAVHIYGALADLDLRQGHLREAAGQWQKALETVESRESWGRLDLPLIGWVYIRMSEILYEWNRLAEAWDHLTRGLERAELGGGVQARIAGYLMAGRFKLTHGDVAAAGDYLEQARRLVEEAPFPGWTSRFERFQLEVWLAQDRLRAAVDWVEAALRDSELQTRPENEWAELAMARVLLMKADAASLERALALLRRLVEQAQAGGRIGVLIEAQALQALAEWRRGDRPNALTALERALRLAEPEGYVRVFADLGLPLARLLQEARDRGVMTGYVETLLAAIGDHLPAPPHAETALPEPLTPREQEILEQLAAGLTNQEIAERLVISAETVKKHTGSIYGKLGVRSRTGAVVRARELHLLE